jgi:quercetin dioxygenase-like cupin family protein
MSMKVCSFLDVAAEKAAEAAGVTVRWVIGESDGAPNFVMRVFDVEPGAATPLHTHDWEHEVFVLAGRGRVYGGGDEAPLGEGDTVLIAPMEEHRFVNESDEPLRFICVVPLRKEE